MIMNKYYSNITRLADDHLKELINNFGDDADILNICIQFYDSEKMWNLWNTSGRGIEIDLIEKEGGDTIYYYDIELAKRDIKKDLYRAQRLNNSVYRSILIRGNSFYLNF